VVNLLRAAAVASAENVKFELIFFLAHCFFFSVSRVFPVFADVLTAEHASLGLNHLRS
jgi:hypothetical protein